MIYRCCYFYFKKRWIVGGNLPANYYYFTERFPRKRRINAEKKIKKAVLKRRRGLLTFTLKYSSCRGAEGREKRGEVGEG